MAFVGTTTLSGDELVKLLQKRASTQPSYYFLRWFHTVSGFISQLPANFPSPEGQMFNHRWEIRWQQQGDKYQVLILSIEDTEPDFTPLAAIETWEVKTEKAYVYPTNETRFPQGIKDNGLNLSQRYFYNPATATIHFIALTL